MASKNSCNGVGYVERKKKRMDARAYRAFLLSDKKMGSRALHAKPKRMTARSYVAFLVEHQDDAESVASNSVSLNELQITTPNTALSESLGFWESYDESDSELASDAEWPPHNQECQDTHRDEQVEWMVKEVLRW